MIQMPKFSVENLLNTIPQIAESQASLLSDEPLSKQQRRRFLKLLGKMTGKQTDSSDDPDEGLMPEQRLLRALILSAVRDYLNGTEIGPTERPQDIARHAALFLESTSEEPFTFRWCLYHLVSDVDCAQRNTLRFCKNEARRNALILEHNIRRAIVWVDD